MDVYRGIPVYPGVVIGPALPLDTDGFLIPKRSVDPGLVENEIQRLKDALSKAAIS
ncbi:MAG: phosphoenolpyruvate-utilizing N-terminal domain-containing protein, partial [Planctomycetia bacterium]